MSNSSSQGHQNSSHNVFRNVPAKDGEASSLAAYIAAHDFSTCTVAAICFDLQKFVQWFARANAEPFDAGRVTVADVADFRRYLREERQQAVATVNRCLVSIRRYFGWLVDQGRLRANPAKSVKELRRQPVPPKGLESSEVRKLLREVELRGDIRSAAIFNLMLFTGARVGDVVALEVQDLDLAERSGTVRFRFGKGSKQRACPLPLAARRAIEAYLEVRPPFASSNVFMGERGPLTERGVQSICEKYSALTGLKLHPHLLRHTFAHRFLRDGGNLVQLAQLLGHSSLNVVQVYTRDSMNVLAESAERMSY